MPHGRSRARARHGPNSKSSTEAARERRGRIRLERRLSSEGDTALIGGPVNDNKGRGAAWVFTRSGSKWTQQGSKLTGRRRERLKVIRLKRGSVLRRQHGADRRRRRQKPCSVRHGCSRGRARHGRSRAKNSPATGESGDRPDFGKSVALSSEGNTRAGRRPARRTATPAPRGCSRARARRGPSRDEADGRRGERRRGVRLERGALLRRQHSPDRRLRRQRRSRCSLGVHALRLDLDPAGIKAHRRRRDPELPLRLERGAFLRRRDRVGGRTWRQHRRRCRVGVRERAACDSHNQPASEVTREAAQLNATVNPNGAEVTECKFEYGTTESYGTSERVLGIAGLGRKPRGGVRVAHKTRRRTRPITSASRRPTKAAPATASTRRLRPSKRSKRAAPKNRRYRPKRKTKKLSVKATEGTGSVTVGAYGPDIGGPPLARSKGAYFQVYHSEGASFKTIEYKDCELGGAKTIWWDNPSTGWEPISEPTAVYNEATHCITVTATESTTPSIAQLSDPRHVGGPAGIQEFGKCEPLKHGQFEDAGCTKEKYKEKNGVRSYKGKYHWYAVKVECFPLKHGHYADEHCSQKSESKKGKGTGGYEKAINTFTTSSKHATLEASGLPTIECEDSKATGRTDRLETGLRDDHVQRMSTAEHDQMHKRRRLGRHDRNEQAGNLYVRRIRLLRGDRRRPDRGVHVRRQPATRSRGLWKVLLPPAEHDDHDRGSKVRRRPGRSRSARRGGRAHAATLSTTTSILEPQSTELRAMH